MATPDLAQLRHMVTQDAALRRRQRLQPVGGKGDKIFPPTYPRRRVGQPLTLRRRPDNPHDQRAVEIWWQDRMLGHLPRLDNAAVAQMLDRGERLEARIAALTRDPDPWKRIGVAVELAA